MAPSRPAKTALWALAMAATGLAPSCEQPKQRIGELWKGARDTVWTARTVIADAGTDSDAPADAGRDGSADAGSNAFGRQKPQPRGLLLEYSASRQRFRPLHTTEADVNRFLDGLKKAVRTKDHEAVADTINYPLVVAIGRRHLVVNDRNDFLASYDRIMTDSVTSSIRNASASAVRIPEKGVTLGNGEDRIRDYVGMSVGNGRIWFDLAEVIPPPTVRYRLLIRMVNTTPPQ
jgi:hypothetical protein